MDSTLRDQIVSIIGEADDLTIATIREDGFPQANTVSYVNEGMTIYFLTPENSQKAYNIAKNNKVSLTINPEYQSWEHIEALSMAALASRVTDEAQQQKIGKLLLSKFPEAAEYEPKEKDVSLAFFKVEPTIISLLDYAKGFGHTEEVCV